MAIIKASNQPLQDFSTKTYIASPSSAAGTTIAVRNVETAVASWGILLGNLGEDNSEVLLIDNISSQNLNLASALSFDHPVDTPVHFIKYDKVIFKRSTSGTTGSATAMTDGTVTIQPGQDYTQFDDTTSQAGYAYRASFYNSSTTEETADSDWITPAGYSFYSRGKLRSRVKGKLFDATFIKDDETINDWINEWYELMNNAAVDVNRDYSIGTTAVGFGTAGLGTVSATDFKDFRKIEVTNDGITYYNAERGKQTDFDAQDVYPATSPIWYPYGDNIFGIKPDGVAGTARISYYKQFTPLDSDGDELPVVMRAYTKSFVDYALAQAYGVDNKPEDKQLALQDAIAQRDLFKRQITPRSFTGPVSIRISEEIDPNTDGYVL